MTESTGSRLDPAFVGALKNELVAGGRGLWRYAMRRFATRYVPLSFVVFTLLALIFGDLPADWSFSTSEILQLVLKPLLIAAIWAATDVAAVHRSVTRPDATILELSQELDRVNSRRWIREGVRSGAIMALIVGGIVGSLMAFTTVPEELPNQSRLVMIAVMVGVTLAWALPMMLVMAWLRNRSLIMTREMLDRSGLRAS